MEEIFKDIINYEGLYQISNLGNIKNKKNKLLKPQISKWGYQYILLSKDGKKKHFLIHRLVAYAFLEKPLDLKMNEVNHKDENKLNNCVKNLEWCSQAYNNVYGSRTKRTAEAKAKPILQYNINGEFIKQWCSMSEVERMLGIRHGDISRCCLNQRKSAGGYFWKYA